MNEQNVLAKIMLALGKLGQIRIFRNNTGMGWQGSVVSNRNGILTLKDARPLHAGLCKGSSDLIGWKSVEITPEMVGSKVAIFTAIEVKRTKGGKVSKEQLNFLERVQLDGGFVGICTDEAEAVALMNKKLL